MHARTALAVVHLQPRPTRTFQESSQSRSHSRLVRFSSGSEPSSYGRFRIAGVPSSARPSGLVVDVDTREPGESCCGGVHTFAAAAAAASTSRRALYSLKYTESSGRHQDERPLQATDGGLMADRRHDPWRRTPTPQVSGGPCSVSMPTSQSRYHAELGQSTAHVPWGAPQTPSNSPETSAPGPTAGPSRPCTSPSSANPPP